MIYSTDFQLDDEKREIIPAFSDVYPYVCLDVTLDSLIGRTWHWHKMLEVDYVVEGELDILVQNEKVHLKKGDVIFINSGVLHKANATDASLRCRIYAHIFSDVFLSGMYGSVFEEKYIAPIINCIGLKYYIIRSNDTEGMDMICDLLETVAINKEEPYGYELKVRSLMSRFWIGLLEKTVSVRMADRLENIHSKIDTERIQKMIEYVHMHYTERISVADIAEAASVSIRECTRCFQKRLKVSPSAFITSYRLSIAEHLLVSTDQSITLVSENCGFASPSYFTKVFRSITGLTPKEYRNHHGKHTLDQFDRATTF